MTKKKPAPPAPAVKENFTISFPMYPFDLMVSIGEENSELHTKLKDIHNIQDRYLFLSDFKGELNPARYALWQDASLFLLRMKELPRISKGFGMLAHEICHIVNWSLEEVGMKLDCEASGEAYAYLTGYLTEEIYKGLNKYY